MSISDDEAKAKLAGLRSQIDDVDDRILQVLAERFQLTRQIGLLKKEANFGPTDPAREQALYDRIRTQATELHIDADTVEALYRTLIGKVVIEHQAIAEGRLG